MVYGNGPIHLSVEGTKSLKKSFITMQSIVSSHRTISFLSVCCVAFLLSARGTVAADEFVFERDVMAVLSKAGCNLGTCHGNLRGKGGLSLSLRGQDAAGDFLALTHDLAGRRINRNAADESLMLLKPVAGVPHEGGQRFQVGSLEYTILRDWIRAGSPGPTSTSPPVTQLQVTPQHKNVFLPEDSVQLEVIATFDDGTTRDVTRLATYEAENLATRISANGLVEQDEFGETTIAVRFLNEQLAVRLAFLPPSRSDSMALPEPQNYIDRHVFGKLQELQIEAAELVSDAVFIRRAYFDLLGIPPTGQEAQAFANDLHQDKRARLIDELMNRPEFADQWALKWSDLLRNEEKVMDARGVELFHSWIRRSFAEGQPLDEFVRELVAGQGSTYENPPSNYYRPLRDPLSRGETTARLFLGVRLQCAKCHNHPFDHWTQDAYYSWAGVFARVGYEVPENKRQDRLDKNEFVGEQQVIEKMEGEVTNARTGEAATPQFLGGEASAVTPDASRLEQLANWLTSPANKSFSQAQVNRIWFHLLGRGLVEPVDDFRVTNPASHPELLEALADDFVRHRYDVRHLIRRIMMSKTYQLASHGSNDEFATTNYARTMVRRHSAEQLLDAQCQLLGMPSQFNGYAEGIRAGQLPGVLRVRLREKAPSPDDRFLTVFGKPKRLMSCECERSDETTLTQAFYLLGGESLHGRLANSARLKKLAEPTNGSSEIIRELYWSALSRAPTNEEMNLFRRQLETQPEEREQIIQDLAWALINSKEFMFRH